MTCDDSPTCFYDTVHCNGWCCEEGREMVQRWCDEREARELEEQMAQLCEHCGKMHPDGKIGCEEEAFDFKPNREALKQGSKWDSGKTDWSFLPSTAIEEVLKVYAGGAQKYGKGNYQKGLAFSRLFSAAMRHLWAWWRGEDTDSESGLSHLAHAAWNVLTLIEFDCEKYRAFDDRTVSDTIPLYSEGRDTVMCDEVRPHECEWMWERQYSDTTGIHVYLRCRTCRALRIEDFLPPENTSTVSIPSIWLPDGTGGLTEATVTTSIGAEKTWLTIDLNPKEKTA